ncbi:MAG: hypothetical protein ACRDZQ_10015, partial [Acidimicrobiales bacterium]
MIRAEAKRRDLSVPIVVDFIHVLEYLWGAARCFFEETDPAGEAFVAEKALAVLEGKAGIVAGSIRRKATMLGLDAEARRSWRSHRNGPLPCCTLAGSRNGRGWPQRQPSKEPERQSRLIPTLSQVVNETAWPPPYCNRSGPAGWVWGQPRPGGEELMESGEPVLAVLGGGLDVAAD